MASVELLMEMVQKVDERRRLKQGKQKVKKERGMEKYRKLRAA